MSFCKLLTIKQYLAKEWAKRFRLNVLTEGFHPQTQTLELVPHKTPFIRFRSGRGAV